MAKYQITYEAYDKKTKLGDKEVIYRCGRIVNKQDIDSEGIVDMAIANGDIKSLNKEEAIALLNVFDATKTRAMYMGKRVKTPHAIMQYVLNGQLGQNDSIAANTRLVLNVTARGVEGKPKKENCSFTLQGAPAAVQISSVTTVGGTNPGEWQKNKQANAVGSNLNFDEKIGDIVTWESEGLTGEVAVDATAYNCLTMAWDSDWDEFTAGREITLTFTLHGGDASATPKTIVKTVKVVVG